MKKKPQYTLLDGIEQNKLHPKTFEIPTEKTKKEIKPVDFVKLCFEKLQKASSFNSERMWVKVISIKGEKLSGTIANDPVIFEELKYDDKIKFETKHIISILNEN